MTRAEQVEALRQHHMQRASESRNAHHYEAWVICTCGYRVNLPNDGNIPETDRAKLNHLLDVLEGLT